MARLTGASAQIRSLANAVSTAFASSGLTAEDLAPSQIEYTTLPWSVPPLHSNLPLAGGVMQDYLDAPLNIAEEALLEFWVETLDLMWLSPGRLLHEGTFATLKKYAPRLRGGVRAFRFSTPAGYPGSLDAMAGLQFSLEVAHAAYISLPVQDLVSDDDNYYVVLRSGVRIGVMDGLPAVPCKWDFNGAGLVPEMLEMPRGIVTHTCLYDQIALMRSNLYKHRRAFGREFDALDMALQALRYLTFGQHCPELYEAVVVAPERVMRQQSKVQALAAAVEVMESTIPDRAKLRTLRATLVPDVMPATAFRRQIFSSADYPFTMAAGKSEAILAYLREQYELERACKL